MQPASLAVTVPVVIVGVGVGVGVGLGESVGVGLGMEVVVGQSLPITNVTPVVTEESETREPIPNELAKDLACNSLLGANRISVNSGRSVEFP